MWYCAVITALAVQSTICLPQYDIANKHVYEILEDKDSNSVKFVNPVPAQPVLREITYYHLIERAYDGTVQTDKILGSVNDHDVATERPWTNAHSQQIDIDLLHHDDSDQAAENLDQLSDPVSEGPREGLLQQLSRNWFLNPLLQSTENPNQTWKPMSQQFDQTQPSVDLVTAATSRTFDPTLVQAEPIQPTADRNNWFIRPSVENPNPFVQPQVSTDHAAENIQGGTVKSESNSGAALEYLSTEYPEAVAKDKLEEVQEHTVEDALITPEAVETVKAPENKAVETIGVVPAAVECEHIPEDASIAENPMSEIVEPNPYSAILEPNPEEQDPEIIPSEAALPDNSSDQELVETEGDVEVIEDPILTAAIIEAEDEEEEVVDEAVLEDREDGEADGIAETPVYGKGALSADEMSEEVAEDSQGRESRRKRRSAMQPEEFPEYIPEAPVLPPLNYDSLPDYIRTAISTQAPNQEEPDTRGEAPKPSNAEDEEKVEPIREESPSEDTKDTFPDLSKEVQAQTGLAQKEVEDGLENAEGVVNMNSGKVRTYGMHLSGDHGFVWNDMFSNPGIAYNVGKDEGVAEHHEEEKKPALPEIGSHPEAEKNEDSEQEKPEEHVEGLETNLDSGPATGDVEDKEDIFVNIDKENNKQPPHYLVKPGSDAAISENNDDGEIAAIGEIIKNDHEEEKKPALPEIGSHPEAEENEDIEQEKAEEHVEGLETNLEGGPATGDVEDKEDIVVNIDKENNKQPPHYLVKPGSDAAISENNDDGEIAAIGEIIKNDHEEEKKPALPEISSHPEAEENEDSEQEKPEEHVEGLETNLEGGPASGDVEDKENIFVKIGKENNKQPPHYVVQPGSEAAIEDKEANNDDGEIAAIGEIIKNKEFWSWLSDWTSSYIDLFTKRFAAVMREEISRIPGVHVDEHNSAIGMNTDSTESDPATKDHVEEEKTEKEEAKTIFINGKEISLTRTSNLDEVEGDDISDYMLKRRQNNNKDNGKEQVKVISKAIYGYTTGNEQVTNIFVFFPENGNNKVMESLKPLLSTKDEVKPDEIKEISIEENASSITEDSDTTKIEETNSNTEQFKEPEESNEAHITKEPENLEEAADANSELIEGSKDEIELTTEATAKEDSLETSVNTESPIESSVTNPQPIEKPSVESEVDENSDADKLDDRTTEISTQPSLHSGIPIDDDSTTERPLISDVNPESAAPIISIPEEPKTSELIVEEATTEEAIISDFNQDSATPIISVIEESKTSEPMQLIEAVTPLEPNSESTIPPDEGRNSDESANEDVVNSEAAPSESGADSENKPEKSPKQEEKVELTSDVPIMSVIEEPKSSEPMQLVEAVTPLEPNSESTIPPEEGRKSDESANEDAVNSETVPSENGADSENSTIPPGVEPLKEEDKIESSSKLPPGESDISKSLEDGLTLVADGLNPEESPKQEEKVELTSDVPPSDKTDNIDVKENPEVSDASASTPEKPAQFVSST